MDSFCFISMRADSDFQKCEVKMDPRSETTKSGMPCRWIICLRNMLVNLGASVDFRQGVKCDIFVNRSIKTRIESKPFDGGKSVMKSQETDFQGPEGTGSGDNSPCLA